MSEGYSRMSELERLKVVDTWRQTRLIAFLIVQDRLKDKNMTQYDFYPLPGDPTKDELEEQRKAEAEAAGKWQKQIIENFRNRNIKV